MTVLFSLSTGFFLQELEEGRTAQPLRVSVEHKGAEGGADYLTFSQIDDWQRVAADTPETLLMECSKAYWRNRAKRHAIEILLGLSDSLAVRTLESLERLVQTRVSPESLLDDLLVAPLTNRDRPEQAARLAASLNCAAIASVFDTLSDLQPLITRLAETWLA